MKGRLKQSPGIWESLTRRCRTYLGNEERAVWLRMSRREETEGVMMLGDPGTGKSQTIHHFLLQIAARRPFEAVVIYDPACEFVKCHYDPCRGDLILNPLDRRSPFWSPSLEIHAITDKKLVTESFLPGKAEMGQASTSGFFLKAARAILGRMLEFKPTPHDLVAWLSSTQRIDQIVADTEHAHLIPRNAHGQRAGVLGVLSDLGETLRLLPEQEECDGEISLTKWAARRHGWIFITSTLDSREALRPLQAVFINILMKRLMSVSPEEGQAHPCWLIVDEVHSLHRLPALYEAETEGRKFGLKLVQGTQGKAQYEEYYQSLAKTMLAAPRLKLFYRCGEPESARWVSDTIGEVEVEKPKIGTTASVEDKGRDSLNYSTVTEHRPVISKEEIMSLPDLHGYWKYGDTVVPFRLPVAPIRVTAKSYIARQERLAMVNTCASVTATPQPNLTSKNPSVQKPEGHKRNDQHAKRNAAARGKQRNADQRKFEYSIAENQPQVNEHDVSTTTSTPSETGVSVETELRSSEIGPEDSELAATQIDQY